MKVTLHNCQAGYEKTLFRKELRRKYCHCLDRIVLFLGKDRDPADVFRSDIPALRDHLQEVYGVRGITTFRIYWEAARAFYNWMDRNEYVPIGFNPFRAWVDQRQHRTKHPEIQVI